MCVPFNTIACKFRFAGESVVIGFFLHVCTCRIAWGNRREIAMYMTDADCARSIETLATIRMSSSVWTSMDRVYSIWNHWSPVSVILLDDDKSSSLQINPIPHLVRRKVQRLSKFLGWNLLTKRVSFELSNPLNSLFLRGFRHFLQNFLQNFFFRRVLQFWQSACSIRAQPYTQSNGIC